MQKPLLCLPPVTIIPYLRYLPNLLGTGLYFALMDAYRDSAGVDKTARKEAVENLRDSLASSLNCILSREFPSVTKHRVKCSQSKNIYQGLNQPIL